MRRLGWSGLGVLVGGVVGVVVLLLLDVPVLIALLLGLAAVGVTLFSWWADRIWKKRALAEKRT